MGELAIIPWRWWSRVRSWRAPVLVLIQARMESTRFPGKVLAPLAGLPMLIWQYRRLLYCPVPLDVVVLSPDTPATWQYLVPCCKRAQVPLLVISNSVEGQPLSDTDVLGRYVAGVANWPDTAWFVRCTGDCPLLDPWLVGRLILATRLTGAVYGALGPGWPDGLDCEVIHRTALLAAHDEATRPSDREHVTPWIWRQPQQFPAFTLPCAQDLSGQCWSVDTELDLAMVRVVYDILGREVGIRFTWKHVARLIARLPHSLGAWASDRPRNAAYVEQVSEETGTAQPNWFTQRYGA